MNDEVEIMNNSLQVRLGTGERIKVKFTKQAEYGVILLSQLASSDETISLTKIAEKCQISYALLRKVAHLLSDGGFIIGEEGKSGGYRLVRTADKIVLRDILEAVGEPILICPCCSGERDCATSSVCPRNSILYSLQGAIDGVFGGLTLDKLVKGEMSCMKTWKKY